MVLAGALIQQNSGDQVSMNPVSRTPEREAKVRTEADSPNKPVSEQRFSSHLTQEEKPLHGEVSNSVPSQARAKKVAVQSVEAQSVDSVAQPVTSAATTTEAQIASSSSTPVSAKPAQDVVALAAPSEAASVASEVSLTGQALPSLEATSASVAEVQVSQAIASTVPVPEIAPKIEVSTEVAPISVDAVTSAPQASEAPSLSVVLPRTDPEADVSPIILVKAQVVRLAGHLQTLGVVSDQPAVISDADFAQKMAIEIYGLVDAIANIAQSVNLDAGESLAALPPEAAQSLKLVMELQSLLDVDSFAALLGSLPKLALATPVQAQEVLLTTNT